MQHNMEFGFHTCACALTHFTVSVQVANAQAANAAAVLISNTENTGFMRMNPDDPTPGFDPPSMTIPSASLPRNSATPLYAALRSGQVLNVCDGAACLMLLMFGSLGV